MLQSSYYISMQNNSPEHFYMWQFTFQKKKQTQKPLIHDHKTAILGKGFGLDCMILEIIYAVIPTLLIGGKSMHYFTPKLEFIIVT